MPTRKGGWWYYTRTVEGQQYAAALPPRRPAGRDRAADDRRTGAPLDGEEILLDGNELAGRRRRSSRSARFSVSPDGRLLAYSTDFAGGERFTLRVKDLVTGRDRRRTRSPARSTAAPGRSTARRCSTSPSTTAWRPYRVLAAPGRHPGRRRRGRVRGGRRAVLGRRRADPQRALPGHLPSASKLTSEVWLLDAADPSGELSRRGCRAGRASSTTSSTRSAADGTDRLLILHNDDAENFELADGAAGRTRRPGRR